VAGGLAEGAVIGAVSSAAVLVSSNAVAATGVSAVFSLGRTNRVNSQTAQGGQPERGQDRRRHGRSDGITFRASQ
jgi:hypothetical protein